MIESRWDRPDERLLAYLERLVQACIARDHDVLDKLLRLNVSSHLPRAVRDEVEYFRRARAGTSGTLRAPIKVMRYLHKMRQLAAGPAETLQFVLPLSKGITRSTRRVKSSGLRRAARRR
jgi:hypothetical protein